MSFPLRRTAFGIAVVAIFALNAGCRLIGHTDWLAQLAPHRSIDKEWTNPQPIRCPFALTGVSIEIVEKEDIQPPPMRVRLRTPDRNILLSSLGQLRGSVHIASASDALQFVRLRTSLETIYCWPGGYALEVLRCDAPALGARGGCGPSGFESGRWAVLSAKAYQTGGFSQATVTPAKGGFAVVRWIWTESYSRDYKRILAIQKWRETVRADGAYTREILESQPEPILPKTNWIVLGRK